MKVRVVTTIDIDPEKWEKEYGMAPVNGELWGYFYEVIDSAVHSSGARHTVKELKIR